MAEPVVLVAVIGSVGSVGSVTVAAIALVGMLASSRRKPEATTTGSDSAGQGAVVKALAAEVVRLEAEVEAERRGRTQCEAREALRTTEQRARGGRP